MPISKSLQTDSLKQVCRCMFFNVFYYRLCMGLLDKCRSQNEVRKDQEYIALLFAVLFCQGGASNGAGSL